MKNTIFTFAKPNRRWMMSLKVLMVLVAFAALLAAGCAHEEHVVSSRETVTSDPGSSSTTTVVKERVVVDDDDDDVSVLGAIFDTVGEILALPFRLVAGIFQFIF